MFASFWTYIKNHRLVYSLVTFFAIASSLAALIPNYLIQLFIDQFVAKTLTLDTLFGYLGAFLLMAFVNYTFNITWVILLFGQSYRYQAQLRSRVYQRLLYLRTPFYERFRSGDLMTRMTSDIEFLGDTIGYGFLLIVSNISWAVSVFLIMIFTVSFSATLISVFPLLIFGLLITKFWKQIDQLYDENREATAQLSNEVLETIDGVRVIRAYGKKKLIQAHFQEKTEAVLQKANQIAYLKGFIEALAKLLMGLSTAIGLAYCGFLVSRGQLSIGALITFQIYLGMFSAAVWGLADIILIYQQGNVSFRKLDEVLTTDDTIERTGTLPLEQIEHIEFESYTFMYPTNQEPTLQALNLCIKRGQTVGIVGKTGSGKTTIVRQLLRQYPMSTQGKVTINGRPLTDYSIETLESFIGYVPQEHILFSKSIEKNIRFGKDHASDSELQQAIQAASFTNDLKRLPEGVATLIGEKGVSISGGQKQRISMARALIREPELLILDDSLSAVDAKTEREIIETIQTLRKDKTTLIISHRLSAVTQADYIFVIENGQIRESGTSEQLLAKKGWYYEQYLTQQLEVNPS